MTGGLVAGGSTLSDDGEDADAEGAVVDAAGGAVVLVVDVDRDLEMPRWVDWVE